MTTIGVPIRAGVRGVTKAQTAQLPVTSRKVVLVEIDPTDHFGALSARDSETIAASARHALDERIPLVVLLASAGVDIEEGVDSLHAWGLAAEAISQCSGIVPVVFVAFGLAISGPALLLGLGDLVVMTNDAVAYVSGPASVEALTGLKLEPAELGGASVHLRNSGVAHLAADDLDDALVVVARALDYFPNHTDELPPEFGTNDAPSRPTPELIDLLPTSETGSYDVRDVIRSIVDDEDFLELKAGWAGQLVTVLARIEGRSVGVIANQPQVMAGTLDIAAAQKGAQFVEMCDSFNIPLLTLVDTPGFMPGKDLEWRGMIRHGAQLVYAYAEATVPRVCLILRKAFGGAYIVMDSKLMGNDICMAWPSAQVAVMGASGAVQILHRREDAETQAKLADEYKERYLTPYVAAERGFIDQVIDPSTTRAAIAGAFSMLYSKREEMPERKHGNSPL